MHKETLNITLRSQAGNNCLSVIVNIVLNVTAAMLNTLVKPNDIIDCEPRNVLVFLQSHGNV